MSYEIKDVFWAVPTRGQMNWNHVRRSYEILARHPELNQPELEAGSLSVCHPRNMLVQKFLSTDAKVLFFVDDDVCPRVTVMDMLRHLDQYDIVGGPYPMVHPPVANIPTPCAMTMVGENAFKPLEDIFSLTGVHPCDALGTGCMMIRREVLEHPDVMPFQLGVDAHGIMRISEDVMFCIKAKKAGFKIAADFDQIPDHFHTLGLNSIHNAYLQRMTKAIQIQREADLKAQDQPLITLAR